MKKLLVNFLKKIFSPICLIISLYLLYYTYHQSEIYWNGIKSDYYLPYYIISTILIIFSILTFFLNQKIKEYLIILLISIIVGLYFFEGYFTFKEKNTRERLYEKETGKKYDLRTRLEIYEDLKKIDNNVKIVVFPQIYIDKKNKIFSLSGISNSNTIHCNESGYYSTYKSDRYGFNNPDKEWDQKEIEYLLVGDSFAHGACENRPNDIASVLRALSNKSVLNLAYDGNGPLIEYATLREYLSSKVKKVLWIYYEGNDLSDLDDKLKKEILKNYFHDLTFTQNLKAKQNKIDILANEKLEIERKTEKTMKKLRVKAEFKNFLKITSTRKILSNYLPEKYQPQPQPQPQLKLKFKKILKLAKDLTLKNNSKLYFIYLPEYRHYKKNFNNNSYQLVKKIINELNIPFIDIHTEVFEKEQNPLKLFPFELPPHYNIEGYRKVAETIYQFTKD